MHTIQKCEPKQSDKPLVSKPLVSIKCMTYNHEKYIAQAIDGFLMQQTTFPFEVLIHDDASTDKTATIIRDYESRFPNIIKGIYEKENQYKLDKHHEKIDALISGKYIAVCEGDDYWTDPNKLQLQVDFLESHPDYTLCFHAAEIKKEDSLFCHSEALYVQDKEYTVDELLDNWIAPTASFVFRREILDYPEKNPDRFVVGDTVLVLKSLALGKVRGFSKKMSVYRIHQSSVTYSVNQSKEAIMKWPGHFENIKENFPFVSSKYINQCLAYWYWKRASVQPTFKLSFQDRKRAFACNPLASFLMIFRPAVILAVSFLSKFVDEQRIWHFVRKVTKKI
ncbi:glycosyltransferase [Fibrobacter succinogenes]|uniref:glycosyltransferase n=1 Tax=Fibrobacter succinogenes TaxID=833 RepID=UPI001568D07F|nr:glycosyltransferase [Fibrobacter succinogenes]